MSLTPYEFIKATSYIDRNTPGRWPHDQGPMTITNANGGYSSLRDPVTKERWDAYQYNPPEFVIHPAPLDFDEREDVRPKPTWQEILLAAAEYKFETVHEDQVKQAAGEEAAKVSAAPVDHSQATGDVHIGSGDGISHMSAIIHLNDMAGNAGEHFPPAVMRQTDGGRVDMLTPDEGAELLTKTARQKNRAESAKNIMVNRGLGLLATIRDPNGGLDATATDEAKLTARETAAAAYADMTGFETRAKHYAAALKEVDDAATSLPPDLGRAKKVLIVRLEAAAMGHIRYLRGIASQQGIDYPAACDDAERAERRVSEEEKVGELQILRQDSNADAERQYQIAKAKIENVKPTRVPEFHLKGHATALPTGRATFQKRRLEITVKQPPLELGAVAVDVGLTSFDGSATKTRMTNDEIDLVLALNGDKAVTFVMIARNICGPNRIEIKLSPPPDGVSD